MSRARVRLVAGAAALFIAFPLGASLTATAAEATPGATVTKFPVPAISSPASIITGPDGAFWFPDNFANKAIGRMTTTGTVTAFTDPTIEGIAHPTVGPDGAIWFLDTATQSIGRITTSGAVSNFTDPGIDIPTAIAAGSDGALWFTNTGDSTVGRMTTSGAVTIFTDPSISNPEDMVAGPDGALWFTNINGGSIGRITTAGVVTHFTLGTPGTVNPIHITAGPDGALWFTVETLTGRAIDRITTAGVVTSYPANFGDLNGLAAGPDGAVWFTISNFRQPGAIGRITSSGTITRYTDPNIGGPVAITAGPDGAMWFTDGLAIGRISLSPVLSPGVASIVEGNSGTTNLQVPITLSMPATQTVTADWSTVVSAHGSAAQANPANDYTPASGRVTFTPGQLSQTVTISINGDTVAEYNEYILVRISNVTHAATGGLFGLGIGWGFITNDD